MNLKKHYMFDVTEDNTPYVTVYNHRLGHRTTLGIWQMDTEKGLEFRIEMSIGQAEELQQSLADHIRLYHAGDTNEDNQ